MGRFLEFVLYVLAIMSLGCRQDPPKIDIPQIYFPANPESENVFESNEDRYNFTLKRAQGEWNATIYEKSKPFLKAYANITMMNDDIHIVVSSLFRKEVEIWSNSEEFRFWSRKHDRTFTFKHDEPNNLKAEFQPQFIKELLSPTRIEEFNHESANHFISVEDEGTHKRFRFVNKNSLNLEIVELRDSDNNSIISATRLGGVPPSRVEVVYTKEDLVSVWELEPVKVSYTSF